MKVAKIVLLFMLVGTLFVIPAFPDMFNPPQGTMEAVEGDCYDYGSYNIQTVGTAIATLHP